jgi:two-component sensor histidine kinase
MLAHPRIGPADTGGQMSSADPVKSPGAGSSSVGFRLAIVLTLALVPLGLLAVWQNAALSAEANARSEAALLGQTLVAAEAEALLIRDMQVLSAALATAILPYLNDKTECTRTMIRAAATDPRYSFVAFTDAAGLSTCNSSGRLFDFADSESFRAFSASQKPFIGVNPHSEISGGSILAAIHPVTDAEGRFLGLTSVSVPHTLIRSTDPNTRMLPGAPFEKLDLFSIDKTGAVLTYSGDFDDAAALLPLDMAERIAESGGPTVVTATARDLRTRTYAIVPLIDSELYLVGSWQGDVMAGLSSLSQAGFIVPILMLAVSVVGAMAAGHFFVSRYVNALASEMQRFASGARRLKANRHDGAPTEIRVLTGAFDDMTARLMRDEAELENTIHQRDVLLREVHHRVKNNLQLIASMMNLQIRHSASPEAKKLLRELQDRVMSLASIHRELYVTSGAADVRADELLSDICRRIVALGTGVGRDIRTEFTFDDVHLSPDQAVPLSLIVTEALTNALKYAGAAPGKKPSIGVSLRRDGGSTLVAQVENSLAPGKVPSPETATDGQAKVAGPVGLGLRLIQAFTHQLGGELTTAVESGRHVLRVRFAVGTAALPEDGPTASADEGTMVGQGNGGTEPRALGPG